MFSPFKSVPLSLNAYRVLFGFFGDYLLTIALLVAASLAGAALIMSMDRTDRMLILGWEDKLPEEARSTPLPGTSR
jgi:hypothetical protein